MVELWAGPGSAGTVATSCAWLWLPCPRQAIEAPARLPHKPQSWLDDTGRMTTSQFGWCRFLPCQNCGRPAALAASLEGSPTVITKGNHTPCDKALQQYQTCQRLSTSAKSGAHLAALLSFAPVSSLSCRAPVGDRLQEAGPVRAQGSLAGDPSYEAHVQPSCQARPVSCGPW